MQYTFHIVFPLNMMGLGFFCTVYLSGIFFSSGSVGLYQGQNSPVFSELTSWTRCVVSPAQPSAIGIKTLSTIFPNLSSFLPFPFLSSSFSAGLCLRTLSLFKSTQWMLLKHLLIWQYPAISKRGITFDITFSLLDLYCTIYLHRFAKMCSTIHTAVLFVIVPNCK